MKQEDIKPGIKVKVTHINDDTCDDISIYKDYIGKTGTVTKIDQDTMIIVEFDNIGAQGAFWCDELELTTNQ